MRGGAPQPEGQVKWSDLSTEDTGHSRTSRASSGSTRHPTVCLLSPLPCGTDLLTGSVAGLRYLGTLSRALWDC